MFLSDRDIEVHIKTGDIVLEPFDKKQLQPASYDIKLGDLFLVAESESVDLIDPSKLVVPETKTVEPSEKGGFVLHAGKSVLCTSKEYCGSEKFLITVNSKSSLARIGLLVHNSAGLINPGHFLNISLVLTNLNTAPILLRPGMEIAQLTFAMLSSESKTMYKEKKHHNLTRMVGYRPPKSGPLARKKKKARKKK